MVEAHVSEDPNADSAGAASAEQFAGSFTQQEAIDPAGIEAAIRVLNSGRLHRYNLADDETWSETALLETEFARYQNTRFCLSCASGGYAMQLALRAVGIQPGEAVLTNAFTLSPVPGAIAAAGGQAVLIETTADLVIDLTHLETMIQRSGARWLLLSHMRGHIADMHALGALLERHGVQLIEDCAHTMGARFDGRASGTFGVFGCYSTQTYKHMNSGEGGFLSTDDEELMARAVILSGSYMLYERHAAAPSAEFFERVRLQTPNCSGRMDNLRAAILRPQLERLDTNAGRWNARFDALAEILLNTPGIHMPQPHPQALEVMSSLQFFLDDVDDTTNARFLQRCMARGVELKWFGADKPQAYTSRYDSWQYITDQPALPQTDQVLSRLFDCRLPLTFSLEECRQIGRIVADVRSTL